MASSQIMVGQQPTIVEEKKVTTTTEEIIPAPQQQPMMNREMMQSQTSSFQPGMGGSQFSMMPMPMMMPQMQRPPWAGRTLLIRPVAAQLTHNTDFFLFKMDPFVEIIIGPQRYKTSVHKNGGKRPQWNQTFSHPLFGAENEIAIIVWDQDRRKADLVGETRVNLAQVLAHGSSSNWYELFWRGKSAGRVLVNMEIV
jgi:hypothetical protein